MRFLIKLWTVIFGRNLAPEIPVEIYFLGISHFSDRTDKELTFLRGGTWNEFSFLSRKLPPDDFGIGNPIVILETDILPDEKRRTQLFTKNDFESRRVNLSF